MNRKRSLMVFLLALAIVSVSFYAWGGGGVRLPLGAEKGEPGASGTAVLSETSVSVQAKGLHPDAVYTVWFVNMKPTKHEAGVGSAPYMFKADTNGAGTYESSLSESPFGKWAMLMIVLHPNGDPSDMKNMIGALSAKIPGKK